MALDTNKLFAVTKKRSPVDELRKSLFSKKQTSEYINDVIRDVLAMHHAHYSARLHEHEDWVHPHFLLLYVEHTEFGTVENHTHTLSSWIMKCPIVEIPCEEDLRKIAEWHRVILFREKRVKADQPKQQHVLAFYIESALKQLEAHLEMIALWSKARFPTSQEDCGALQRKDIQESIAHQEKNITLALKILRRSISFLAPESVREYYESVLIEEQEILYHLKKLEKSARK